MMDSVGDLMKYASDFETLARVDVEVILRTDMTVKLRVSCNEGSGMKKTHSFKSLSEALAWLREGVDH